MVTVPRIQVIECEDTVKSSGLVIRDDTADVELFVVEIT